VEKGNENRRISGNEAGGKWRNGWTAELHNTTVRRQHYYEAAGERTVSATAVVTVKCCKWRLTADVSSV